MKTPILFSILSLTACGIDSVEPLDPIDPIAPSEPQQEKLAANALNPADLASANITVSALTQAYADALSQTKVGREALSYLVNCALAPNNSISSQYNCGLNGCQTITYTGGIGLMANWKTATPTQAQQRQLSSCVLARLNELGRTVTISLRGNAYTTDASELATYVYPEGGFFGNIFQGADYYWGSCDSPGPTHAWRQCAQDGHCSPMAWAGDCTTACSTNANGDYASCTGANGVTYGEPTTVWLNAI